jgi:hypothetical protein
MDPQEAALVTLRITVVMSAGSLLLQRAGDGAELMEESLAACSQKPAPQVLS